MRMAESLLDELFAATHPGDAALIGDPVEHSLSPVMQNAAFQMWKKTYRDQNRPVPTYHKFRVRLEELPRAMELAKKHRLRGLNVTVPHKVAVLPLLTALDESARSVGAVNTVVVGSGGLKGFNTDGAGFKFALALELGFDPSGRTALVLGAGGTGVVIVHQLIQMGAAKIFWWNRSLEKMGKMPDPSGKVQKLSSVAEVLRASLEADLIVNATSVGLKPADGLPVLGLSFKEGQFVFDVIYHRTTAFMKEAVAQGARVSGGLPMLVYQGAESFKIWTGAPPPVDIMRMALIERMKNL